MVRNIAADRPIEPPGCFVCCLVGLVEVVAMLTIIVGSMADFQADRSNAALCSAVADLSIADSAASTESGAIEEPNDVASTLTDLEKSMLGTWEDDYNAICQETDVSGRVDRRRWEGHDEGHGRRTRRQSESRAEPSWGLVDAKDCRRNSRPDDPRRRTVRDSFRMATGFCCRTTTALIGDQPFPNSRN